jgi:thioredoxin 1
VNPFSERPDLASLVEQAVAELRSSGGFDRFTGRLPAATSRTMSEINLPPDDQVLLQDMFSERMIALTANDCVVEATDDNLDRTIIEASRRVVVMADIYSSYCRPCNQILPVVYQLAQQYRDRLAVVKINASRNPRFAQLFLGPVQLTPAFLFFHHGGPLTASSTRLGRLFGQRASNSSSRAGLERRIRSVLAGQR